MTTYKDYIVTDMQTGEVKCIENSTSVEDAVKLTFGSGPMFWVRHTGEYYLFDDLYEEKRYRVEIQK